MARKWNRDPSKGRGTLAGTVIRKTLSYPLLGYLPDEKCAVMVLDGENDAEASSLLESSGYAVTRLCDPQMNTIGCVPEELKNMPDRSYGLIFSSSWLCGDSELEHTSRLVLSKLREGGIFVGCVPNRFACSLDAIDSSVSMAIDILDENTDNEGDWVGVSEYYSPQSLVVTLEAIGLTVIDIFGWQIALSMLSDDRLIKDKWSQSEQDSLTAIEYRLSQERNLLGCAPTIQFVAKKPNPTEETTKPIDR